MLASPRDNGRIVDCGHKGELVSWPTPGMVTNRRQAAEALVMRLMSASMAATAVITAVPAAINRRMAAERPAIHSLALRALSMKAAVGVPGSRTPNTTAGTTDLIFQGHPAEKPASMTLATAAAATRSAAARSAAGLGSSERGRVPRLLAESAKGSAVSYEPPTGSHVVLAESCAKRHSSASYSEVQSLAILQPVLERALKKGFE